MSLAVSGKARLITDPRKGRSGAGKPWANAVARVSVWRRTVAGWEEADSYTVTVAAFEDVAVALVGFAKGDEVEFTGRVRELKVWTPERGEPRAQLGIALDDVHAPERRPRSRVKSDATENRPDPHGAQPHAAPTAKQAQVDTAWPRPGTPDLHRGDDVAGAAGNVVPFRGDSSARLLRAHANNPYVRGAGRGRPA